MKIMYIDGAKVIRLSKKGLYGNVNYKTEMKVIEIEYVAICQYENNDEYYLFACDEKFNVLGDSVYESLDDARNAAYVIYKANMS